MSLYHNYIMMQLIFDEYLLAVQLDLFFVPFIFYSFYKPVDFASEQTDPLIDPVSHLIR